MRVRAFAKINLSLRVLGAREDGYHELRTIFQSIALHDTLTIRPARGPFRLICDDPQCPSDDSNLIWRAAERLWRTAGRRGRPRDIAVEVAKRIPLQGGLGGGSSDAAATLRVLGRLWHIEEKDVRAAATELGADVPYFFEGGTVLGLERGDLLFPLIDWPAAWVVLVIPEFGVSTQEAFSWFDEGARGGGRSPEKLAVRGAEAMVNDLERPVAARYPAITRIARALRNAGAIHAGMSGSGSAVFGIFARRTDAARAAGALAARTIVTRTLNRSKYQALART